MGRRLFRGSKLLVEQHERIWYVTTTDSTCAGLSQCSMFPRLPFLFTVSSWIGHFPCMRASHARFSLLFNGYSLRPCNLYTYSAMYRITSLSCQYILLPTFLDTLARLRRCDLPSARVWLSNRPNLKSWQLSNLRKRPV